jgi:CheY-like chemotaxis protein
MSNKMKELLAISKDFNVLYVEDDLSIQAEIKEILSMFYNEVITANDGMEGLELLKKNNRINLIVSDIQMPNMNGLEMAENIRNDGNDIPIVLTTAFNDQEYFLKSIEVRIDKYMLKPINDEQMIQVLYDVTKLLVERKNYLKLKAEDDQRKLQEYQQDTISKITDAFVSPAVIFKGDELVYYSEPFMNLFEGVEIDLQSITPDTVLFEDYKGYLTNLADFDEAKLSENKIYVKQNIGKRIFKVIKKNVDLNDEISNMYILVDITMEEYQKVKIESYVKSLETMMVKSKKKELIPQKDDQNTVNKKEMSDSDVKKLRKRHSHVMTSKELVSSIDDYIITELQELDDLDIDLRNSMYGFDTGDFTDLHEFAKLLQRYADEIYIVEHFEDLYAAIKSLADLLYQVDMQNVDKEKYKDFALYLNSVREDLALWRKSIFVNQNTDNIHYLDSSLFSTVLHIELLVNNQDDIDTDEDDLEFF